MAYFAGIFIVGLFFGVMHFFTELNAKQKMLSTLIALLVVLGAIFYNLTQSHKADHVREIMRHFNQGKKIQCGEITVTNSDFTLSIGTQTFIGKKEGEHAGKMLQASGCE